MDDDRHILVVDDERDLREAVREYLQLKGYRVSVVASGAAARAVVDREPVDLRELLARIADSTAWPEDRRSGRVA